MKINSITLSLKKPFLLKDKTLLFSFAALLIGLISGVISYYFTANETYNALLELFVSFNTVFSKKTIMEIFSGIVLSGLPYFTVMFILGGSIFGKLFCLPISAVKAMGIGTLTSYFYCTLGLKGLEYCLLVFFPGKCILLFGMLLLTKNCIEMSSEIIYNEKSSIAQKIKLYCIKGSLLFVIFIFSWFIDFLTVNIFSDLFAFNL